jgi:3-oxoacyl-(acyl-carrier-protein) synthase/surfactin synthase thioesterase subunit/acyl carrier protein
MDKESALKDALYTIKKLKQLLNERNTAAKHEPVAIVGLGVRLPEVNDKYDYWNLLCSGKNIIKPIPEERWDLLKNTTELQLRDKTYNYPGGYLSNIDKFDAAFFGISPREAIRMEPQQRLLLEVTYEAIEDAGIPIDQLKGSNAGVFVGLIASQYLRLQQLQNDLDALYMPTGAVASIAANRISYLFDLKGPSLTVETSCSSSLVAVNLACLHIQNNLCDLALTGGVNINLLPSLNLLLSKAKMLSPDGQCKTFDADANGYVQGEGAGVIVLKSLTKALQDKDRIYAVIAGGGVNQDGKTNGLTAPNGLQQEALLKRVYASANINPVNISYVECHGTGTLLGDPIEVQALGNVISKQRTSANPCWIGSVKTNIGHLEPAAGILAIIKTALALQHAKIPPHLNFDNPNPHISFGKYNFSIPRTLIDWPQYGDCLIAGISGFGFGGTNAHIILRSLKGQEINEVKKPKSNLKENIFVLSAKDDNALNELVEKWRDYLKDQNKFDFHAICYNSRVRRSHYKLKIAIIANSNYDLVDKLLLIKNKQYHQSEFIFANQLQQPVNKSQLAVLENNQLAESKLISLANSYVNNLNVNWCDLDEDNYYLPIDMPYYAWQRKSYWPNDVVNISVPKLSESDMYPLVGQYIDSPLEHNLFKFTFNIKNLPEVRDNHNLLHIGYYMEMLGYAVKNLFQRKIFAAEDVHFLSPAIIPAEGNYIIYLVLEKNSQFNINFSFFGKEESKMVWSTHCKGALALEESKQPLISVEAIKNECKTLGRKEAFYERIKQMGLPIGESTDWHLQHWHGNGKILCEFRLPTLAENIEKYSLKIHPGIIDSSLHQLFMLLPTDAKSLYIASRIQKITYFGSDYKILYLYGSILNFANNKKLTSEFCIFTDDGTVVTKFENIELIQFQQVKSHTAITKRQNFDEQNITVRRGEVINYLIEIVASILAADRQSIETNVSLLEIGMDSLGALALINAIKNDLDMTCSVQDILKGISITALANFLLNVADTTNSFTEISAISKDLKYEENAWIAFRQKKQSPELRLLCFPYGGGGASSYKDWHQYFPKEIEICPIQLPGRENRLGENALSSIEIITDQLISQLKLEFKMPFAFYGHSFGALIAYELSCKLNAYNMALPRHLFLAAFPEPKLIDNKIRLLVSKIFEQTEIDEEKDLINLLNKLTTNQLKQILLELTGADEKYNSELLNDELLNVLYPIFMADMKMVASYPKYNYLQIATPLTVIYGKNDPWINISDQRNWCDYTTSTCEYMEINAGHLFIREPEHKVQVIKKISNVLVKKITESKLNNLALFY